jgi:hypothetical protein
MCQRGGDAVIAKAEVSSLSLSLAIAVSQLPGRRHADGRPLHSVPTGREPQHVGRTTATISLDPRLFGS